MTLQRARLTELESVLTAAVVEEARSWRGVMPILSQDDLMRTLDAAERYMQAEAIAWTDAWKSLYQWRRNRARR